MSIITKYGFFGLMVKLLNDQRGNISLSGTPDPAPGSGGQSDSGDSALSVLPPDDGSGGSPANPLSDLAADFPDGLEDDLKQDPSLKVFIKDNKLNYKNLIKSYVHAQRQMGKKGVILPTKNSSEEEWSNFFNQMRPSELEKYDIKPQLKEGQKLDEEFFGEFKKQAHALGLTPSQAEKLHNWHNEVFSGKQEMMSSKGQEEYNKQVEGLKSEWGEGFKNNLNLAQRAVKEFADKDMMAKLQEKGLDSDVDLIKLFHKVGSALIQEGTFNKDQALSHFGMDKGTAQKRANQIFADASGPYYNSGHAQHNDFVNEMMKLQEIINS